MLFLEQKYNHQNYKIVLVISVFPLLLADASDLPRVELLAPLLLFRSPSPTPPLCSGRRSVLEEEAGSEEESQFRRRATSDMALGPMSFAAAPWPWNRREMTEPPSNRTFPWWSFAVGLSCSPPDRAVASEEERSRRETGGTRSGACMVLEFRRTGSRGAIGAAQAAVQRRRARSLVGRRMNCSRRPPMASSTTPPTPRPKSAAAELGFQTGMAGRLGWISAHQAT